MKENALAVTSQALAITSNLLAITIEVGIIVGGVVVYKKLTDKPKEEPQPQPQVQFAEPPVVIQEPYPKEPTFRERWDKIGRIFKAVVG